VKANSFGLGAPVCATYRRPLRTRAPEAAKVISEVARVRGETIARAVRPPQRAGLTTQVPMRLVYLTSAAAGRSLVSANNRTAARTTVAAHQAGQPAESAAALAWLVLLKHMKGWPPEAQTSEGVLDEWLILDRPCRMAADTISSELW